MRPGYNSRGFLLLSFEYSPSAAELFKPSRSYTPGGDSRQPPKKQEAFYEAYRMELTHYEAAGRYLDGVMNGRTGIPLKAWKAEQEKLTAERKELSRRYLALKDEVKEAEQIRKGVYAILREESRKEQPTHKQDLDR